MKKQFDKTFADLVDPENLLTAWREFVCGKRNKQDVQEFGLRLADSIISLHADLANLTYRHGDYHRFSICDPKPRIIHKASVRDRVLHHAIYRMLYPFFDRTFIADSFSCRIGKGTHKALNRFTAFARRVSRNNTVTCWVLKCDIRKFFASVNHPMLLDILRSYIPDPGILWLLKTVISSFSITESTGLPLGNLTSQLFCNVYMNEFDQFVKHRLKAKQYVRYADDFVLLSDNRAELDASIPRIARFLQERLQLELHPHKLFVSTLAAGVDFLGWVHFSHHRVLRTTTKRRMVRRVRQHPTQETLQSYLGLLRHGNAFKVRKELMNNYWLSEKHT